MKKPSILVLSASTGNGHVSAANAVVEEAQRRGLRAEHIDIMDHVSPGFRRWYRGGYETLVRRNPRTWGHLYKTSDRPRFNYHVQTNLDKTFCKRLEKMVETWAPDWVICTHSLPQPALAKFANRHQFRIGIVVTDLYVHRMWLRGDPDRFFVPQEWSADMLRTRLPEYSGEIVVTGIPIHPVFSELGTDKAALRSRLGFRASAPEKMVLMVSGGIGGGPVLSAAEAIANEEVSLVVVAGRNERNLQNLRQVIGHRENVIILGAVPQFEMAELMKASDILVSKPGGLTTFESLAIGLPFIVYWPFLIPGQEEGNAEFLESCGAGMIVRNLTELRLTVGNLIKSDQKLNKMRESALCQALPGATGLIVDSLVQE